MSIFDKLLLKVAKFTKLAEEEIEPPTQRVPNVTIPSSHEGFVYELKKLLSGNSFLAQDYLNWLKTNENVNIARLSLTQLITNYNWDYEYNHDASFIEAIIDSKTAVRLYNKSVNAGDLSESLIVNGSGKIPRLWAYVGDFRVRHVTQNVDKELGHNFFIWEAFSKMFHLQPFPADLLKVAKFVHENKDIINKIRNSFTSSPKAIGSGADGVAFDAGNYVFKIFTDHSAYTSAVEAKSRIKNEPELAATEAMIYDVGVLGEFENQDIYYYLMEKMIAVRSLDSTLTSKLKVLIIKIIVALLSGEDSEIKELKPNIRFKHPTQIKNIVTHAVDVVEAQLKGSQTVSDVEDRAITLFKRKAIPPLNKNWLRLLIEEISFKYLTSRIDLHTGNIGITTQEGKWGEFRYFDPSYGGNPETDNSGVHMGGGVRVPFRGQEQEFE